MMVTDRVDLRLLFVDDMYGECEPLISVLESDKSPYKIVAKDRARNTMEAFDRLKKGNYDLIFLDINFGPEAEREGLMILRKLRQDDRYLHLPVVVFTNVSDAGCQEDLIQEGVDGFLSKQHDAVFERLGAITHVINNALRVGPVRRDHLSTKGLFLQSEQHKEERHPDLFGVSHSIRSVFRRVVTVASAPDCPNVLILGAPGTGKSAIARAIHRLGVRRAGPFEEVLLNAISSEMLEAVLFGVGKGALRLPGLEAGLVTRCDHGTLFLDEIGSMPLDTQTKLLQVIREKRVREQGTGRVVDVDFQLICTTSEDLETCVRRRTFRADLYHRIRGFQIELPPLRKRFSEDVREFEELVQYTMARTPTTTAPFEYFFTDEAKTVLREHAWPGNYAEWNTLFQELTLLSCTVVDSKMVVKRLLEPEFFRERPEELAKNLYVYDITKYDDATKEFQRTYVNYWLEQFQGNAARTAKEIGVDPATVYRKLHFDKHTEDGEAKLI